jgi:hypothetical protein
VGALQYLILTQPDLRTLFSRVVAHVIAMCCWLGGSRVATDCTQVYNKGVTLWLCLEHGVSGKLGMMWCSMGLLLELIELSS